MNRKARIAAEDLLRDYWQHVHRAKKSSVESTEHREEIQAANKLLPKVNALLRTLVPDTEPISATSLAEHEAAETRVERAEDILGDWDEMLGNDGETLQFGLPLNALEVNVLEAARHDWSHDQYRKAVASAAAKLNEITQNRLDVYDISDSALMSEAFSEKEPKPDRPRLRCPGTPGSETVTSMQDGAKLFAMGAMRAIRNPAVHWTRNGNPVSAAEQLAALSVVARWVRYWDVVRYEPPASE